MLEEAISEQIALEARAQSAESEAKEFERQLKGQQAATKTVEESLERVKFETEEAVSELKDQLLTKETEYETNRK